MAIRRSDSLAGIWPKAHSDVFCRVGPAPNGNIHVSLENHVVCEEMGEPGLGFRARRSEK